MPKDLVELHLALAAVDYALIAYLTPAERAVLLWIRVAAYTCLNERERALVRAA